MIRVRHVLLLVLAVGCNEQIAGPVAPIPITRDVQPVDQGPPPPHQFGPDSYRIGVFTVPVSGYDAHELAAVLEPSYGILTRPGIHCAPLAHAALGTADCGGTTRLSFGPFLSKQDVKYATDALADVAASRMRTVGAH